MSGYVDAFLLNLSLPPNVNAFLATIRNCEGTNAPQGWRALYGWHPGRDERLFDDMSVHPRRRFWIRGGEEVLPGVAFGANDTTTAAGALQENWPTWTDYQGWRKRQGLPPAAFDQAGQTGCGLWLIRDRAHAYEDIVAGDFQSACAKASSIWASLPGSQAGQHPRSPEFALATYRANGGTVA